MTIEVLGVKSAVTPKLASRLDAPREGGSVLVGIRPHDLELARTDEEGVACVEGIVDITEHTGTEVFATVDVKDKKVIARLPRAPQFEHGDRVKLGFHIDNVVLFDETTQASLLRRTQEREKVSVAPGATAESQ